MGLYLKIIRMKLLENFISFLVIFLVLFSIENFVYAEDTISPTFSSFSPTNNSVVPGENFDIEIDYIDTGGAGINTSSAIFELSRWNSTSYGLDISGAYVSSRIVGTSKAIYEIASLPAGKYKYSFSISDISGNVSKSFLIFYIDTPEVLINKSIHESSMQGVFDDDELVFDVKTIGVPYNLGVYKESDFENAFGDIINNWNGSVGVGYLTYPYGGLESKYDIPGNEIFVNGTPTLNTNGNIQTFTHKLKISTIVGDLHVAGEYEMNLGFNVFFDYTSDTNGLVNGKCGIAAGVGSNNIPTLNLCSSPISSVVSSGTNYWSWECSGVNGGATAVCKSPKTRINQFCTGLVANSSWNSVSTITQSWNGVSWYPSLVGQYNTETSTTECRFKCNVGYTWDSNTNICIEEEIIQGGDFAYTGEIETYIVPVTGNYQLETWGAQGGSYDNTYRGGKGAYSVSYVTLNENDVLKVLVGGKGSDVSNSHSRARGGGGGSFISTSGNVALSVAGGGGGVGLSNAGISASASTSGTADTGNINVGGTGGNGGAVSGVWGGQSGAGFIGNGLPGGSSTGINNVAMSFINGGVAGTVSGTHVSLGGFGGGGAGTWSGGGGGGYSGGGGGWYAGVAVTAGGGGGSYYTGTGGYAIGGNAVMPGPAGGTMTGNEGNGFVRITFVSSNSSDFLNCSSKTQDGYLIPSTDDGNTQTVTKTININGGVQTWQNTFTCNGGNFISGTETFVNLVCEEGYYTVDNITCIEEEIGENGVVFTYTGEIETYIVPVTGNYQLETWGAQGGPYSTYVGGKGAYSVSYVTLNENDILKVLVGGKGNAITIGYGRSGGGGGGTYISTFGNIPLCVAGGGGGVGVNNAGIPGTATTTGTTDSGNTNNGGMGDNGGAVSGVRGGQSGAGFTGDGLAGGSYTGVNSVGKSFVNGGDGGTITSSTYGIHVSPGGFGGGGAGTWGGGGGGGYSGGGGGWSAGTTATAGGGGGSYYIGTGGQAIGGNAVMPGPVGGTMTGNEGNGFVRITFVGN